MEFLGFLEFLDSNLLHVTLTLLLSYLIWAKFFNNSNLSLNKNEKGADSIFAIILIFVFIFASIFGFSYILIFILNLLNQFAVVSDAFIIKIAEQLVKLFAILGLIWLSFSYNKDLDKNYLKRYITIIITIYLFLIFIFLGFWLLVVLTPLRNLFWGIIIFVPSLISIVILSILVVHPFFRINIFRFISKKRFFKFTIISIILPLILGLMVPYTPEENIRELSYEIYDLNWRDIDPYLKVEIPISIKTFGLINSISPLIPIRYGVYNLETENIGGRSFRLLLNFSEKEIPKTLIENFDDMKKYNEQYDKKFGFTGIIVDKENNRSILKYDWDKVDKDIKQILLQGYIKKNISSSYQYWDNSFTDVCNENTCLIKFNITNNLNLPVYQYEKYLFDFDNRGVKEPEKCRFVDVKTNHPLEGDIRMIEQKPSFCSSGNTCDFRIVENKTIIFEMNLFIDSPDIVKLSNIEIKKPIQVEADFYIDCR